MHYFIDGLLILIAISIMIVVIVGVHELGHFCCARMLGVQVERFAIGFGKPLFTIKSKANIEYVIATIPLGGYVKLLDSREGKVADEMLDRSYDHQAIWKRLLITIAGPVFNFLFAIAALWLVMVIGFSSLKPVVKQVTPHSLMQQAAIQANDEFVSIGCFSTPDWQAVLFSLIYYLGDKQDVPITVKQPNGKLAVKNLQLAQWKINSLKPQLLKSVGIEPLVPMSGDKRLLIKHQDNLGPALKQGIVYTGYYAAMNLIVVYKIIVGKLTMQTLTGPISIFTSAANTFKEGLVSYVRFLAVISIAVGVVNLFPIPGLDGAQAVYLAIEKVRRKPVSIAMQVLVFKLGMILLSLLFIQVMLNDLQRIFIP